MGGMIVDPAQYAQWKNNTLYPSTADIPQPREEMRATAIPLPGTATIPYTKEHLTPEQIEAFLDVYEATVLGIAAIPSPEQQDFLRNAMRSGRRAILAEAMECRIEFIECDSCRAKPGSPTLCTGCLHNREVIELLKKQRSF